LRDGYHSVITAGRTDWTKEWECFTDFTERIRQRRFTERGYKFKKLRGSDLGRILFICLRPLEIHDNVVVWPDRHEFLVNRESRSTDRSIMSE